MTEWKDYHDPEGFFSLRIPGDWIVQRSVDGPTRIGNKLTGLEATFPHIRILMGPSPLNGKGIIISFDISATTHPFHRQVLMCPPANTTLAGLPAYHLDNVWVFDTPKAHIQISYRIPGVGYGEPGGPLHHNTEPRNAPVSSEVIASNQQAVNQVIASFRPATI